MSFPPTDFMDALCDPRAFLSAQEKRGEQLKALGIEEADLDTSHVIQSKGDGAGGKGGDGKGKDGKKDDKPVWSLGSKILVPIACLKVRKFQKEMFASLNLPKNQRIFLKNF